MSERQAYLIAGTSLVCAAVCGLLIIALRNAKPCPCAEHTAEAEAERVAQASAVMAQAEVVQEKIDGLEAKVSEYLNGKTMDSEQAEHL